jgi:hypothetical protein
VRNALTTLLVLSGLAAASPAAGQSLADLLKTSPPEELATAFKAICVDHAGDRAGQIAAATGPQWHLKARRTRSVRLAVYEDWPLQLHLSREKKVKSCILVSSMDQGTTSRAVADKAQMILGAGASSAEIRGDVVKWKFTQGARDYVVQFKHFGNPGTVTGVFAIGAEVRK